MRNAATVVSMIAVVVLADRPSMAAERPLPMAQTRYGRAVVRFEARPKPWQVESLEQIRQKEQALGEAGVEARWIQVVDNVGNPLCVNPFLPCPYKQKSEAHERMLKAWVDEIHASGMAAMSWYPMAFCQAGHAEHPQWRQVCLEGSPAFPAGGDLACCPVSGYGDALIAYCKHIVGRYQLDGIWFDGSVWSPIWQSPLPVTCACEACQKRFQADTGMPFPERIDWLDPAFRRWLQWRYRVFGEFLGRLAREIRTAHPHAAVVVNHYHRPGIPWNSAVPIDRYAADIISGSEAHGPDRVDLTVRLCRAYGRSQAEVWRPLDLRKSAENSAEPLVQHALCCYVAGGYPSFGGDWFSPLMAPTAKLMAPIMRKVHPLVATSASEVAIHVSQQTETMFFGPTTQNRRTHYFVSLDAWTRGLGEAHLPPDYVYDADLSQQGLAGYRILLLPLSLALSKQQAEAVLDFTRRGGTLLLGMAAGQLDEHGRPRTINPLAEALGFRFGPTPSPMPTVEGSSILTAPENGFQTRATGLASSLTVENDQWRVVLQRQNGAGDAKPPTPGLVVRDWGKGTVAVLAVDPARIWGSQRVAEGRTQLCLTDKTAAAGRYSLRFVDHPIAPASHHPDLETALPSFGLPEFTGGVLEWDMRASPGAVAVAEVRSKAAPVHGPVVRVRYGGPIVLGPAVVCPTPKDAWFHLKLEWTFVANDEPCEATLTVTLPDGATHEAKARSGQPGFRAADWFVLFGPGSSDGTFLIDNYTVKGHCRNGTTKTIHQLDFEAHDASFCEPEKLVRFVAQRLVRPTAPRVQANAPSHVRMGVFRDGPTRLLVHLHDRRALREDWLEPVGSPVVLRIAADVESARLAITDTPLDLESQGRTCSIAVPPVGLYRVVEITLAPTQE